MASALGLPQRLMGAVGSLSPVQPVSPNPTQIFTQTQPADTFYQARRSSGRRSYGARRRRIPPEYASIMSQVTPPDTTAGYRGGTPPFVAPAPAPTSTLFTPGAASVAATGITGAGAPMPPADVQALVAGWMNVLSGGGGGL